MRGANVVIPNLTPLQYRVKYEIYPGKACITETAEDCRFCLNRRIESHNLRQSRRLDKTVNRSKRLKTLSHPRVAAT